MRSCRIKISNEEEFEVVSIELIVAMAGYAFISCATPGPNNILLAGFGAKYGFVRTLPAVFGIIAGGITINIGVGLGLGALLQEYAAVRDLLKFVGCAYLVWLALKLLRAVSGEVSENIDIRPFSFLQAVSFQYVNPKVWVMLTTANVSFAVIGPGYWFSVAMITLVFAIVGTPSIMLWAGFGHLASKWLSRALFRRLFNLLMASLTILCVLYIWSA